MPKFIKLQEGLNGGRYSDGKPGVFCYVNIDHIIAIEGYVGCCYIITTDHDYPIYISHEQFHEIVNHLESMIETTLTCCVFTMPFPPDLSSRRLHAFFQRSSVST